MFKACLGFVSKDDYSEPFIAAVWDSLPGPAPILQGIFQKAKAVLCNCKGTLCTEVKGKKRSIPAQKPWRKPRSSDNQLQANKDGQS